MLFLIACHSVATTPVLPHDPGVAPDVLTTDLDLNLQTLSATATLQVLSSSERIRLNVGELDLQKVTVDGEEVKAKPVHGWLSLPGGEGVQRVEATYHFPARTLQQFDGWMPDQGTSFLWPNYCGNLFPCNPDTNDGVTFQMNVHGVDPTLTAVYPTSTYSDAPPYMPGIAVGDYTEMELGTTDAGTHLRAWYLPGQDALGEAKFGTSHLVKAFDFYEKTYGPYAFGPEAGTVAVDWGDDSIGGMEHHPFFHVGKDDFWNEEAQVHEAGHGWFGDGVRLACWEDFVLSEGTTTYITARALESVDGPNLWPPYVDNYLVGICENRGNTIVLPDETCNEIDFEQSPLWSLATYMKGACFYEDVADLVGPEQVDAVIGEFYQTNVNHSARMQDMIDLLKQRSAPEYSSQIDELANEWLRSYDCPPDYARRCRSHQR